MKCYCYFQNTLGHAVQRVGVATEKAYLQNHKMTMFKEWTQKYIVQAENIGNNLCLRYLGPMPYSALQVINRTLNLIGSQATANAACVAAVAHRHTKRDPNTACVAAF